MVEPVKVALALSPFLVAGVALLGLGWSALRSGIAALAAALASGLAGVYLWPEVAAGGGLFGALFASLGTSWSVVFVLFGGLFLYRLMSVGPENGAVGEVSRFLGAVEPRPEALAVAVVVGAGTFFESVTGFGVAVVICAPILLAAGFSPLRAAALSLWSQCAVPWGALGVGTVIGADLSGLSFRELSEASALLNLPLFPVYALATLLLAGGSLRSGVPEAVALGLAAGLGTLATSYFLAPELSGAVGGAVALGLFLFRRRRRLRALSGSGRTLFAAAPYGALVGFIVLLAALRDGLTGALGFALAGPGVPLLLAAGVSVGLFGLGGQSVRKALRETLAQWWPTAGSVVAFVAAGQVVAASGAAAVLASFAAGAGFFYPAAATLVGGIGGALTGSNAASNALFMPFQAETAARLGDGTGVIAAVQNVSGSHTSLLSPQRVVLAAAAVGLTGREGEVVRAALPPVAVSLALVAGLGLLLA
ncbi:L-lactate permease [Rubrobacter radiotolerans]|uniref:L-lactate permease n=1 Tax=Rubrobacter radiotolerans TaxID=42256 RepID=A0A023X3D2_RUBRA|nr:L-lactate permease [Rubrobacter radiotolerans]AHY46525.1 L-lactate permease [Rubrobacter radiotolerans]MDX5893932.1 L-lactate permease [Rubrobacter radiotolerans]SMC04786.1 lactate permease [Rubrobacter radiotolerans DSM 5868]